MGIGILAGVTLRGPAVQAATEAIAATLSTQPIYVDGAQVSMTAYAINGHNYIKLRDVGEAVGFNVYWDGSAVQIESDQPYTGEPPADPELTEKSVQAAIWALRDTYPPTITTARTTARTATAPTGPPPPPAQAGPPCAPTPLSVTCRGGGSTARVGKTSVPAT